MLANVDYYVISSILKSFFSR